jgi:hypothetical protein
MTRSRWLQVAVVALGVTAFAPRAEAQFSFYTDRTAFETALSGAFTVEDFSGPGLNPLVSATTTFGAVGGGVWTDYIFGANSTVWSFGASQRAWGGDFDLFGPGGPGSGISLVLANGASVNVTEEIPGTTAGFWGFIYNGAFNEVRMSLGSECCVETYTLDNMTFAAAAVPEPSSLLLVGLGVVGLAAARRRRQQNQA